MKGPGALCALGLIVALGGCATSLAADAGHDHVSTAVPEAPAEPHATAESRFRATSSHPFDDVSHWVRVFDGQGRTEWQQTERAVEALGDLGGLTVCDLGSGTGHFLSALDRAVGSRGTVFAIETEPNLVAYIRERAEREGLDRVVPVLTSFDRLRLEEAACDLILVVNTYHHLDKRDAYLEKLKYFFTPQGRLAVIDWRADVLDVGPGPEHRIARDVVVGELEEVGYRLVAEHSFLRYQYFLVAVP